MLLMLFLIDPALCYVVAFNEGGHGWCVANGTGPKQSDGQLRIAFDGEHKLIVITCLNREEQALLRSKYANQTGVKRSLLGLVRDLEVYTEVRSVKMAKKRGQIGGGAQRAAARKTAGSKPAAPKQAALPKKKAKSDSSASSSVSSDSTSSSPEASKSKTAAPPTVPKGKPGAVERFSKSSDSVAAKKPRAAAAKAGESISKKSKQDSDDSDFQ